MGLPLTRTPRDFERIYGPPGRVTFVRDLGCVICGAPAENAHTRTGGTSRKGDYTTIIPLCFEHHRGGKDSYHAGAKSFAARYNLDLEAIAAAVEAAWLRSRGSRSAPGTTDGT